MHKRIAFLLAVFALVLMFAAPAALAQGGPFGMFKGSVWVAPMGSDSIDVEHLVFNAREGRGNQSANGHFFAKSSDSATFDHRVNLDDVRTTGVTPTGFPLGVPTGFGVCAFASGHYSGPIEGANFLCMLVCQETPFGADLILLVPSGDRDDSGTIIGMYFFIVERGSFTIHH